MTNTTLGQAKAENTFPVSHLKQTEVILKGAYRRKQKLKMSKMKNTKHF